MALDCCPLCEEADADICHLLHSCKGTETLYKHWAESTGNLLQDHSRLEWPRLRMELFAGRVGFINECSADGEARIRYVGLAASAAAKALSESTSTSHE